MRVRSTVHCTRQPDHHIHDHEQQRQHVISKYIMFRISKNLDIEPETLTKIDKVQNLHHVSEYRQCVCGCRCHQNEEYENGDDEEFLSACEVENWADSSESGNSSSASSFAFPVLDARWSGSPTKMPRRKSYEHKKLACLRKPKLVARFLCRWCRSF